MPGAWPTSTRSTGERVCNPPGGRFGSIGRVGWLWLASRFGSLWQRSCAGEWHWRSKARGRYSYLGTMGIRLIAGFVITAFLATTGVPCGGWQSSAEARHDCCAKGSCPSMLRKPADHNDISQEAADQCCARSEEKNQQNSSQFATVFFAIAPVITVTHVPQAEVFHVRSARL